MHEIFPFSPRRNYPHMGREDAAIWERFIKANPEAYSKVQYDVRCGKAPTYEGTIAPEIQRDMEALWRKRIDVVGIHAKNGIDLIELKPRAGLGCLGQVLGYCRLYEKDHAEVGSPQAVIITDKAQTGIDELCEEMEIRLIEVGYS